MVLTQRQDSRIFQATNAPDIIKAVFDDAQIINYRFDLSGEYANLEYCLQYRETDSHFVQRLMAEHGMWYYFEHSADQHILVVDNNDAIPELVSSLNNATQLGPIPFDADNSAAVQFEHISNLELINRVNSGAVVVDDYDYLAPKTPQKSSTSSDSHSDLQRYDYPGRFAGNLSQVKVNQSLASFLVENQQIEASSDVMRLIPGHSFEISGHPRLAINGDYTLLSVTHVGKNPQVLAEESSGNPTTYHNQFVCIARDIEYQAPKLPAPMVDGPQTAFVVGPAGEEIFTDALGRVKVQFHWDRYGKCDEHTSSWVRVSQSMAAATWGAVYLPRIGHEVIVTFLEGDPDKPLITGAVYNGLNYPPYALPEHKTRTVFRTQSHKADGYHELYFEDEADQEMFALRSQKDMRTEVVNNRYRDIGNDEFSKVAGNQENDIQGDRKEQIDGHKTSVTRQTFSEDVARDVEVTYNANWSKKIVVQQSRSVFNHQKTLIGKDEELIIAEAQNTHVNRSRSVDIGADDVMQVGQNLLVQVSKNASVKSDGSTTIISAEQISAQVGKAGIILQQDGNILLYGADITIEGVDSTKAKGGNVKLNPGAASSREAEKPVTQAELAEFAQQTHKLSSSYALEHLQGLTNVFSKHRFCIWLASVFGYGIPPKAYVDLYDGLEKQTVTNPLIEVIAGNVAYYDNKQQTIFIGVKLIKSALEAKGNRKKAELLAIIVHEFGHHIDNLLRNVYSQVGGDAELDEGAAFAVILGNLDIRNSATTEVATYNGDLGSQVICLEYPEMHAELQKQRNYIENDKKSHNGDREYFSAGGDLDSVKLGKYGHRSIEFALQEYFDKNALDHIYYGNWLSDYSQVVDPKILEFNLDLLLDKADDASKQVTELKDDLPEYLNQLASQTKELQNNTVIGLKHAQAFSVQLSRGLDGESDVAAMRLSDYLEDLKQQQQQLAAQKSTLELQLHTKAISKSDKQSLNDSLSDIESSLSSNIQYQSAIEKMLGYLNGFKQAQQKGGAWSQAKLETTEDIVTQADLDEFFTQQEQYLPAAKENLSKLQTEVDTLVTKAKEFADKPAAKTSGLISGGNRIGSQAISREALTQVVEILARKEFPQLFAEQDNSPYRLTPEKLGVYRPEVHLDNPRGITAPVNPELAKVFRADFEAQEGEIDPQKWYKNYFDQSIAYAKTQFQLAADNGRTPQGFIHFGQALHVMEDIYSHSNFVELCINRLSREGKSILPRPIEDWVDPVQIPGQTQAVLPLVTGLFGAVDTLVSLLSVIEKNSDHPTGVEKESLETSLSIILVLFNDYQPQAVKELFDQLGLDYSTEDDRISATQAMNAAKRIDQASWWLRLTVNGISNTVFFFVHQLKALLARQLMEAITYSQDDTSPTDPTHSQIAKDPDDHPLHELAALCASDMVAVFGQTIADIWAGKQASSTLIALVDDFFVHPDLISEQSPPHVLVIYQRIEKWVKDMHNFTKLNMALHYEGHLEHELAKLKIMAENNPKIMQFFKELEVLETK